MTIATQISSDIVEILQTDGHIDMSGYLEANDATFTYNSIHYLPNIATFMDDSIIRFNNRNEHKAYQF